MDLKQSLKLSSLMLLVTGVIACSDSDKFKFETPTVAVNPPPAEETVEVKAENDSAEDVNGSTGATAVVNVLVNDTIDGEAATTSNVDFEVVTADAEGVLSLSAEGNVDVSANSVAGSYSLEYQICEKGTANCDSATVTVAVVTTEIEAVDDVADNANGTNGETAVVNVLANDTFGGAAVVIDAVDLSEVTPDPSGSLTLNADGSVDLASGTANGDYQLTYQICEKGTENCAQATVTVTVNMMTGVFMKGMGQGVAFETDSMSGMTNDLGQYSYLAGENITFSIGATVLGETVEAKAELDVTDLIPGVTLPEDSHATRRFLNTLWSNYGNRGDESRKQYQLINMMTLLFSVDKDKNSANGVQVDEKLHTAFANNSYDFKVRLNQLANQYRFKRNLFDAYNDGAVENARIFTSHKTLDLTYDYLGLTRQAFGRVKFRSDSGADGSFEQDITYHYDVLLNYAGETNETTGTTYSTSYNEFGDYTANSHTSYSATYEYNIHGQQTIHTYDNNGDGTPDYIYTYEYDEHGNLVSQNYDNNSDGVAEQVYSYEYDSNSNQTLHTWDNNADGTPEYIYTYEYDAKGNRLTQSYDYNGDGTINTIYTYTYDEHGNQLTQSYDNNADGTVDNQYAYEYDDRGNRIRQTVDYTNDGIIDNEHVYEFDVNNNRTYDAYDNNGDGVYEWIYTYEFDDKGNQTLYSYDNNGDGTVDRTTTREYDSNGALILVSSDNNADGVADSINTYVNDANGNLTQLSYDSNADGAAESIYYYVNDADGNNISYTPDYNADGTFEYIYEYEYQAISFLGWNQRH